MAEEEDRQKRPLLVVISDTEMVREELRSRRREVRRWRAGGDADSFDGDPAEPATFEWTRDAPSVTAVIDLESPERARAVLRALRSVRPDAAALLLSSELADVDKPEDGTLARGGRLRDVLRVDVEEELERLEAERRVYCLKQFAAEGDVVPILIHEDPDPDAVSSALAVAKLLDGSTDRHPIVTLEPMTRPENLRMVELLDIRVTRTTTEELRQFERVITVDTQPRGLQRDGRPRLAVIDHHPAERDYSADFADIRPGYGATASMLTEYLRATDEDRITESLATALLFGIRTDTDSLMRGVSSADVEAYAYLQQCADIDLIRRFEKPSYARDTALAFGRALADAAIDDELIVVYLGELDERETHALADIADFCLAIENITWVVAAAVIERELVLTIRHAGKGGGAGALARVLASSGGRGGGHSTMARVTLPLERAAELLGDDANAPAILGLVRRVMEQQERGVASRRDLHPAHRA